MPPLLVNFNADPAMADALAGLLAADQVGLVRRRFPDGESYLRLAGDCTGRDSILLCDLSHPNERALELMPPGSVAPLSPVCTTAPVKHTRRPL